MSKLHTYPMQFSIRAFLFFFLILLTTSIHIIFRYIFPYPFSQMNSIFVFLVLFLSLSESGWVVWAAFFSHAVIELYSVSPFGITLYSATLAILFTLWLSRSFFVNRSWYTTLIFSVISLFLFRIYFLLFLWLIHVVYGFILPDILELITAFGWELLFTSSMTTIVYTCLWICIPRIRPDRVSSYGISK